MMLFQGISPLEASAAAGALSGGLFLLQFLRNRHPRMEVASLMLWTDPEEKIRRRVLWEKLSRIAEILPLLLAVFFLAAALAEPIWRYEKLEPVVLAADRDGLEEAAKLAASLDTLSCSLIFADAAPLFLREAGKRPRIPPEDIFPSSSDADNAVFPTTKTGKRTELLRERENKKEKPKKKTKMNVATGDRKAALLLASELAGEKGRILFFGSEPPPWMPENALFLRVEATSSPEKAERKPGQTKTDADPGKDSTGQTLSIFAEDVPEEFYGVLEELPGIELAREKKTADLLFRPRVSVLPASQKEDKTNKGEYPETETEELLESLSIQIEESYRIPRPDSLQKMKVPEAFFRAGPSGSLPLGNFCFLSAIFALLIDFYLWNRRITA